MRVFTAIDIADEVRARLNDLLVRIKPSAKLQWSQVEKLHVTAKFIGEWSEERLPELIACLKEVPRGGPITVSIRGLGWFPNPRNPRVFWAGVEGDSRLATLAAEIDQRLVHIGVPAETRPFHPHLTLARRKESVRLEALRALLETMPTTDFGTFSASSFFLYLSSGGKYTKLQEFYL